MKNNCLKIIIKMTFCFCLLALCSGLIYAQTPTPTVTPDDKATRQASPTPTPITDPEAKEFEDKFNYLQKLVKETPILLRSEKPDELKTIKTNSENMIELSQDLSSRLDKVQNLATRVAPTVENAKLELQFVLRQCELLGYDYLSNYYRLSKNWNKAIDLRKMKIELIHRTFSNSNLTATKSFEKAKDSIKLGELTDLGSISSIYLYHLEQPSESIKFADEAIKVAQSLQKEYKENAKFTNFFRYIEADALDTKASAFTKLDQPKRSIEFYQQALAIFQELPNQQEKILGIFQSMGSIYDKLLDFENALNYYNKALKLTEELNDKENQTLFSSHIGIVYFALGNKEKVKEYFKRNLAIVTSQEYTDLIKNRQATIPFPEDWIKKENQNQTTFSEKQNNFFIFLKIAETYLGLEEYDKSIEYSKKSLQFSDSFDSPNARYVNLSLIAVSYQSKEDWQSALNYYKQASEISKNFANKRNYGSDLASVALTLFKTKKPKEALPFIEKALIISQSLQKSKEDFSVLYGSTLNVLAQIHHELGNRRLAIFYGKQAVNAIQRERQQLKNLDAQSQRGYLQENIKPYRRLISWLIAENRVAEAEQVLQMLKEEELSDYLRRDDKVARDLLAKIPPDSTEKEALQRFDAIADEITKIGSQVAELEKEKKAFNETSPDKDFPKQAELDRLENDLIASRTTFTKFLDELGVKFSNRQTGEKGKRIEEISATQALLKDLNQPNTVIISTVVEEKQLNLIVTTSKVNHAHTIQIPLEKLNELAVEFRQALQDPKVDPRPLGKQLYDLLFPSAVQKDLAGVKADTIIWSLDGILRYVPMSALWDGKQYLVEKYNSGVITLASRQNLKDQTTERKKLTALGLGVSKEANITDLDGTPKTFPALSAVPQELCSVVNDPKKTEICATINDGKSGVINGTTLSDEQFTFRNFSLNLGRYPIVHIASHFALNPGNEGTSYLLLGGEVPSERKLTLVELKNKIGDKLGGTELLTLSACNTGMSAGVKASGEEVESFAAAAISQGVKSVVSSLWSVDDPSTRDLMTEFYQQMQANPKLSKAEAIRLSQLKLMNGNYKTGETPAWRGAEIISGKSNQPAFKKDEKAPFAHPYYWSPFVLVGNWK